MKSRGRRIGNIFEDECSKKDSFYKDMNKQMSEMKNQLTQKQEQIEIL